MSSPKVVHVLLLTADPELAELYRHECPQCVVTIAKDAAAVARKSVKHRFDAIIIDSHKDWMNEVRTLSEVLHSKPVILAGSTPFLRRASESVKALSNGHRASRRPTTLPHELGFDEYVGAKLRDFVRRMKLGAGSNLYPLLMNAVEKPLIGLVLDETRGNQIQAAALLGLNRNTLRKKIKELKIPVLKK
jgi:DNA-binding protein Fis